MGGLAEREIADSIQALTKRDANLAMRVLPPIRPSMRCSRRSRRRPSSPSPAASRWRWICGKSCGRSACRTIWSGSRPRQEHRQARRRAGGRLLSSKLLRGVEHMASLVLGQLKQCSMPTPAAICQARWQSGRATRRSTPCAPRVPRAAHLHDEDPRNITFCIHLMFCAKNIERMGDHATNIAETVHYMVRASRSPKRGRRAIPPLCQAALT